MPPDAAVAIIEGLPYAEWVEFTVGRDPLPTPHIIPQRLTDYTDTMRALIHIEALVTVDTSVAHLAGALGIPTYVMVTTLPDMRWGLQGERTPWYDSWAIVRQQHPNDWSPVIETVIDRLRFTIPPTDA